MDNDQITALAREYAEIECPEFKYKEDKEWRNYDIESATLSNGAFLTWLSRRFFLVEKEAVRKQFESAKRLIEVRDYNKQCIGVGSRGVLERLFPDLRKEVGG